MAIDKKITDSLQQFNGAEIIQPIIISDQTVEPIVVNEFGSKAISEEAFMNEIVTVTVQSTTDENAAPHILMSVNGRNQPFFRDVPTPCRRMFLEVLARCKESKYTQTRNPFEPDRSEMVQRSALAYPFTVEDKNPKGAAWLRAVMAEIN